MPCSTSRSGQRAVLCAPHGGSRASRLALALRVRSRPPLPVEIPPVRRSLLPELGEPAGMAVRVGPLKRGREAGEEPPHPSRVVAVTDADLSQILHAHLAAPILDLA